MRGFSRAAAAAAFALMLGAGAWAQPAPIEPGASAWSPAPKSRARLVSAGPVENGFYRAGVEISLDGNALTYWRNPGDAGVPPEFDFKGSTNLAKLDVIYPAPERHDEDGSEVFGWRKAVIFPLKVQPKDAGKPVTLALTLRYAACEKICIPSEGRMELTLTPTAKPSLHAARIAHWAALAPRPASEAGASLRLEPIAGGKKQSWRVRVSPFETGSDLFAEGDDGWFFDTRVLESDFKLVLAERPSGAPDMTNVRLTLRRPSGAIEFATKLDAGGAAP
jgi:DsbC/DsbD-like thiol-disulfide interchange protein